MTAPQSQEPAAGVAGLPRGLRVTVIVGAVLVLAALVMLVAALLTRQSALAELRAEAAPALQRSVSSLQGLLDTYQILPRVLAREPLILNLYATPTLSPATRETANEFLSAFNAAAGASETYVLDALGNTIAASNSESPVSFVGRNFAFRPYFHLAIAGWAGLYFAHGTTSNRPGFYFSYPVKSSGGDAVGVAVVKIGQERLESAWSQSATPILVTDAAGVVFITNREDFRYHALRPLPPVLAAELVGSRQYGDGPLAPLPVVGEREFDGVRLVSLHEGRRSVEYLLAKAPVPNTDWEVSVLVPTATVEEQVGVAVLLAGSASAIATLFGLMLAQKRLRTHERLAYQARVAEALRESHDRLEAHVVERTRDLVEANQRLSREIQERERAEQIVLKTQNELIQASKLAALGQLAAGIVHELNQPLAAIRAYAANARTFLERGRPEAASGNLDLIGELTERMATLTAELKTFARRTSDEVADIDLRASVGRARALLDPRLRRDGIELHIEQPDTALTVRANAIRIEQVLVNLLKNAADALLEAATPVPRIGLRLQADPAARRARLVVTDNGPGIPPEALGQLFDPFFTTKPVGEGLGLGLSISYGIVENLGGTIRAENLAGGGACFTVELPLPAPQPLESA